MDQLDDPEDDEKIARWQISPSVLVILQQACSRLFRRAPWLLEGAAYHDRSAVTLGGCPAGLRAPGVGARRGGARIEPGLWGRPRRARALGVL